ncbi:MAG TPA: tRNA uridine-5-carboxymethylaminomethyl(34) synthesis GTPase MnmE [Chitinophagaceae bacterium]|nr:tRNA uridine-5-carboxymethylaminomethyl(34) synthesis GTPase MnmE [Chitinophagaceae bacterium]
MNSFPPSTESASTIVALSTPQGAGAIGVIRLSGELSINIANQMFAGKDLSCQASHTLHFGKIMDEKNEVIDEVVISLFKNPHSYTGEDVIEISCHGSAYIIQKIIERCQQLGAKSAKPGEFTQRAFLNGKLDLSQAESVADIIAAENKMQLEIAFQQMRGGYSAIIEGLRNELIEFAALIELELDFSEEDVEFADRGKFHNLIEKIKTTVEGLIQSFELGNVLKNGIPVAIIGEPNVGKSTLLNVLLNEEKALVSDIAGTTRDFIEDTLVVEGIQFRFIDTAGLRETNDELEAKGIERSMQKLKSAKIVLYLADIQKDFKEIVQDFSALEIASSQEVIIVLTKLDTIVNCDAYDIEEAIATLTSRKTMVISATTQKNIELLKTSLLDIVQREKMNGNGIIVTNTRHVQALRDTQQHIHQIEQGLTQQISGDFLSIDIRLALQSLGEITGAVEVDRDILGTIFGKFCIGK